MTVRRGDRDRGTISIFVAIGSVMMLAFLGLVVDCGGQLRALADADAVAQEAARVGGQQIDQATLFSGKGYVINLSQAYTAATAYLHTLPGYQDVAAEPPGGLVLNPGSTATSITVVIQPHYRSALLGRVVTLTATGTATLVVNTKEGN